MIYPIPDGPVQVPPQDQEAATKDAERTVQVKKSSVLYMIPDGRAN